MNRSSPPTASVRSTLSLQTQSFGYRTPMKFGGRVVEDVTVSTVVCEMVNVAGKSGIGIGSMTMGVAWAWPDASIADATKLAVVIRLTEKMITVLDADPVPGHPVETCLALATHRPTIVAETTAEFGLTQPIPELAVLLAASPIEGALFDAHGKAAGRSSYDLLTPEHLRFDLGELLDWPAYRGLTLDRFVTSKPAASMPLYHLVGALDPLTEADVQSPVGDGLPETLGQWITRNELTHLKIKLSGDDRAWDLDRIRRIDSVATATDDRGRSAGKPWAYSLDFNERCGDEETVLALLDDLKTVAPAAFGRIQYIEQPTARDLFAPGAVSMHRAARQIPVVIDESLTDHASLRRAIELGYSGVALKACKGHAEALLLGAVAQQEKLFLCVQDLTCVGASLLHSASLASHLPTVSAVESNGRQYCPAGNVSWQTQFGPMFEIREGQMPTAMLSGDGLGY